MSWERIMTEQLELNRVLCKLSFEKKVENVEFVEILGNMDIYHCNDPQTRGKILENIGKGLFKKRHQPVRGNTNFHKTESGTEKLTLEEIDLLLTSINGEKGEKVEVLSQEEIKQLLTAIEGDPFSITHSIDIYAGLNYVVGDESKEPHHKPHFHVYKKHSRIGTFDFEGNLIAGDSSNIKHGDLQKILKWKDKNTNLLEKEWKYYNSGTVS